MFESQGPEMVEVEFRYLQLRSLLMKGLSGVELSQNELERLALTREDIDSVLDRHNFEWQAETEE